MCKMILLIKIVVTNIFLNILWVPEGVLVISGYIVMLCDLIGFRRGVHRDRGHPKIFPPMYGVPYLNSNPAYASLYGIQYVNNILYVSCTNSTNEVLELNKSRKGNRQKK